MKIVEVHPNFPPCNIPVGNTSSPSNFIWREMNVSPPEQSVSDTCVWCKLYVAPHSPLLYLMPLFCMYAQQQCTWSWELGFFPSTFWKYQVLFDAVVVALDVICHILCMKGQCGIILLLLRQSICK